MSDSVHYGHHEPNLVDSSVRHGYVVRTVGSSLFRLEFTRQPRRKSLCDRLLFVYFRWSVLDALRLLAARQTAHAEDVAVFCAGWLPVVLLREIPTASTSQTARALFLSQRWSGVRVVRRALPIPDASEVS